MERKNKVSSTPAGNGRSPKKKRKKSSFNIINILKVLLIVGVLCGIIGGAVGYFYVMGILKNIEPIDPSLIEATLTENSVIVDDQGRVLEQIQNAGGATIWLMPLSPLKTKHFGSTMALTLSGYLVP
jgi:penicillin-binding protein 1A